jgi:hypothetical protein
MAVVDDTAKIAAFIASDRSNTLTGTIINASCEQVLDRDAEQQRLLLEHLR